MKVRYLVLGLLVLLTIITYMDRVCISVAGPRMQKEFNISTEHWGWVLSAFVLAYGVFEIPGGAWGDRFGQRRVLTRIVTWWSVFTMLTGAATSFSVLVATRFLFGAGEAGAFPNASGSIGRWFPSIERARAQGIVLAASRAGGALTPLLVVPLMAVIGWRGMFYVFGAVGLVWAAAWWLWYRDFPAQHAAVSAAELAETQSEESSPGHSDIPWGRLFRSPQLWVIMAMYGGYVWGMMFYLTWLPEYLIKGRGLDEAQMARFASLPFLLGACGNVTGGFLSDWLSRRHGLRVGRAYQGSACLAAGAACLLAAALVRDNITAAVLLGVSFGLMDMMLPCAWAVCLDVGRKYVGAVSGAMNTAGQAGGFVCTLSFGYLAKAYGYNVPIAIIAVMIFASSVLFLFIDPNREIVAENVPAMSEESQDNYAH